MVPDHVSIRKYRRDVQPFRGGLHATPGYSVLTYRFRRELVHGSVRLPLREAVRRNHRGIRRIEQRKNVLVSKDRRDDRRRARRRRVHYADRARGCVDLGNVAITATRQRGYDNRGREE